MRRTVNVTGPAAWFIFVLIALGLFDVIAVFVLALRALLGLIPS